MKKFDVDQLTASWSNETLMSAYDSDGNLSKEKLYPLLSPNKQIASKFDFKHSVKKEKVEELLMKFFPDAQLCSHRGKSAIDDTVYYEPWRDYFYIASSDGRLIFIDVMFTNYLNDDERTPNTVDFYYDKIDHEKIMEFSKTVTENNVYGETRIVKMIAYQNQNWRLREAPFKDKTEINFETNYNDDFKHSELINTINEVKPGLILLGGVPGSGKTNFIKWCITNTNRNYIYMSANQIGLIDNPEFISFAIENLQDSVIILEDCEEILISRNQMKGSQVQAILNLSDGIVGSTLNITIIGTFNTKDNIDKAIFRKGRLLYIYDFKELAANKATELSKNLGHNIVYNQPTILSEIYNIADNGVKDSKSTVGFGISAN